MVYLLPGERILKTRNNPTLFHFNLHTLGKSHIAHHSTMTTILVIINTIVAKQDAMAGKTSLLPNLPHFLTTISIMCLPQNRLVKMHTRKVRNTKAWFRNTCMLCVVL